MSDMKCPFCGQKLEPIGTSGQFQCGTWGCDASFNFIATRDVWEYIDRTKKQMVTKCNQLEFVFEKLKGIKAYYDDSYADPHTFVNWHIVAQRLANDADDAIKAITALEQKDVK